MAHPLPHRGYPQLRPRRRRVLLPALAPADEPLHHRGRAHAGADAAEPQEPRRGAHGYRLPRGDARAARLEDVCRVGDLLVHEPRASARLGFNFN